MEIREFNHVVVETQTTVKLCRIHQVSTHFSVLLISHFSAISNKGQQSYEEVKTEIINFHALISFVRLNWSLNLLLSLFVLLLLPNLVCCCCHYELPRPHSVSNDKQTDDNPHFISHHTWCSESSKSQWPTSDLLFIVHCCRRELILLLFSTHTFHHIELPSSTVGQKTDEL